MDIKDFEELKYGCPSYNCTWGAKCPASGKQCSYSDCPFIYWLLKSKEKGV